jgi:hypothetical protein
VVDSKEVLSLIKSLEMLSDALENELNGVRNSRFDMYASLYSPVWSPPKLV